MKSTGKCKTFFIWKRKKGKNSFTLIELLMVIAIIAILAAMLMPALQKARNTARSITCLNQLKTLGNVAHLYSDTYDGYLISTYTRYDGVSIKWNTMFGDSARANLLPFRKEVTSARPELYMKNYYCPTGKVPVTTSQTYGMAYVKDTQTYFSQQVEPGAYITIVKVGENSSDPAFGYFFAMKSGRNRGISGFPIFADSVTTGGVQNVAFHKGLGGGECSVAVRHQNKANITFADGHCGSIEAAALGVAPHKIRYYGYDTGVVGIPARTMD